MRDGDEDEGKKSLLPLAESGWVPIADTKQPIVSRGTVVMSAAHKSDLDQAALTWK